MRRYPEYKDRGIKWLGEIPANWKIKKLKWIVKEKLKYGANEIAELDDPQLPRYIRITDFGENGNLSRDTFKSLPFERAEGYFLTDGDILFARSGATVGKTFQFKNYDGKACFAGYLIKASPDNSQVKSDYLYLYTKSNSYENWKNSIFSQATIQNIGADKYNYLEIPIPTITEQDKIALFVTHKANLIDTLIEKKQKQIELLKEQRAAIINQAVTKGLDPNVKMKGSGIEWLGEIPEHWEVVKLKFLKTKLGSGITPRGGAEVYQESGIPLLRSQNIHFDGLRLNNVVYISQDIHDSMSGTKVQSNDVLLNITGASIGRCCYADDSLGEANVNQHVCIIRPNQKILTQFLCYLLASEIGQSQVFNSQMGTSREGLNFEQLKGFQVVVPPKNEQILISDKIEEAISNINLSIDKIENQIKLLQEYRTTLISEVVTGKIDVRDEVIP